jgi:hypothetical protein
MDQKSPEIDASGSIQSEQCNLRKGFFSLINAEHITPSLKLRDPSMTLTKTDSSAHLIGMIKKWSPSMSIKNTSSWCCKFIDEYHGEFRKNIVAAEIEVFAQEYRRALCPKHLFNGENIFTKYRVGIDNSYNESIQNTSKVYVFSKFLDFHGVKLDLKSYIQPVKEPLTLSGLGTCTLFAKFLGEIDLKVGNIGLRLYRNKKEVLHSTFTQLDSGCSFAGLPNNILFPQPAIALGYLTDDEITFNPATSLNPYNYLNSYTKGKKINRNHQWLVSLSQEPLIIQETVICALRCVLVPDNFNEELLKSYFSKQPQSTQAAEGIKIFIKSHQDILLKVLINNHNVKKYFFSRNGIKEGRFRKEVYFLFESMKDFIAYKKVRVASTLDDFIESFMQDNNDKIALLLSTLEPYVLRNMHDELISHLEQIALKTSEEFTFFELLNECILKNLTIKNPPMHVFLPRKKAKHSEDPCFIVKKSPVLTFSDTPNRLSLRLNNFSSENY